MTQQDIDQGILNVVIGVATVKPAEFVIIRIGSFAKDHPCARLLARRHHDRVALALARGLCDALEVLQVAAQLRPRQAIGLADPPVQIRRNHDVEHAATLTRVRGCVS